MKRNRKTIISRRSKALKTLDIFKIPIIVSILIALTVVSIAKFYGAVFAITTIATDKSSVQVGDTFNVIVNVNDAAAWNVHVASNGPVAQNINGVQTEGCTLDEVGDSGTAQNTSGTFTITCIATATGTINFTLSGDTAAVGDDESTPISGNAAVIVTEASSNNTSGDNGGSGNEGGNESGGENEGNNNNEEGNGENNDEGENNNEGGDNNEGGNSGNNNEGGENNGEGGNENNGEDGNNNGNENNGESGEENGANEQNGSDTPTDPTAVDGTTTPKDGTDGDDLTVPDTSADTKEAKTGKFAPDTGANTNNSNGSNMIMLYALPIIAAAILGGAFTWRRSKAHRKFEW